MDPECEIKESLNSKLDGLKSGNRYLKEREERIIKEEKRKKEASEFIKKLKMEK